MGPKVTLNVEQELLKFTEGCSVLTSLNERGNEHFLVWFGYHSSLTAIPAAYELTCQPGLGL